MARGRISSLAEKIINDWSIFIVLESENWKIGLVGKMTFNKKTLGKLEILINNLVNVRNIRISAFLKLFSQVLYISLA